MERFPFNADMNIVEGGVVVVVVVDGSAVTQLRAGL
jgi:hypothetical protein